MRTFIVGKAKVVASGGDCIMLTAAQYAAAKVVRNIGLSCDELMDLMEQLREEVVEKTPPAKPVDTQHHWKVASVPVQPAPPSLSWEESESMTWRQVADMGPYYKIRAIKKYRDLEQCDLRTAKEAVESYMDGIDGAL